MDNKDSWKSGIWTDINNNFCNILGLRITNLQFFAIFAV